MQMIRQIRKFLRDRSGSMTIEFVVLTPLLLSALVFSFEFGKALWAYDVMTRDLRAGVRYLSRVPVYNATSQAQAENIVTRGVPGTGTPKHFPWTGETFSYSTTAFTSADYNTSGIVVTMTANVTVPVAFLDFINRVLSLTGGAAIATSFPLSVSYQSRHIGN